MTGPPIRGLGPTWTASLAPIWRSGHSGTEFVELTSDPPQRSRHRSRSPVRARSWRSARGRGGGTPAPRAHSPPATSAEQRRELAEICRWRRPPSQNGPAGDVQRQEQRRRAWRGTRLGCSACASSQSTSGGPLMLIEVVSTPLRNPAADAGTRAATARSRSCHSAAAITATPTPIWSGSRERAASTTAPSARPGSAGRSSGGRRGQRASCPSSEHEQIQQPRRAASSAVTASVGLHHGEQRRREHQREAEAGGRLDGGTDQRRQGGQDHQPTVTSSFGKPVRIVGLAVGHDHEVLDPHAHLAGQVHARLHRHGVARLEAALRRLPEPRPLVHLEPDAVPEPVAEVLLVARRVDDLARHRVHVPERRARPGRGERPRPGRAAPARRSRARRRRSSRSRACACSRSSSRPPSPPCRSRRACPSGSRRRAAPRADAPRVPPAATIGGNEGPSAPASSMKRTSSTATSRSVRPASPRSCSDS